MNTCPCFVKSQKQKFTHTKSTEIKFHNNPDTSIQGKLKLLFQICCLKPITEESTPSVKYIDLK